MPISAQAAIRLGGAAGAACPGAPGRDIRAIGNLPGL